MFAGLVLAVAIALEGVTADVLRAHAYFDANNVRLGDPMILSVEFIGTAEFADLHPPALSREVDASVWKVDDRSAKTDTYRNARRLVYRVRPLKEGVHVFPALTFAYELPRGGGRAEASTVPVPVHVKPGAQASLAGLEEDAGDLPMPDGLHCSLSAGPWNTAARVGDDELFRWRRACRAATAAAFAPFDFPEGRLNEAACAVVEGNWAHALRIYSALEWRIGQTPEIERGLVAALSRKNGARADLPPWRIVLRPVLRHPWPVRLAWAAGVLLALAAAYAGLRRAIRAFACVAAACLALGLPLSASAVDPFAEMDRLMKEAFGRMEAFGAAAPAAPRVDVRASMALSRTDLTVGEPFEFVLSLEGPKSASFGQIRLTPSEMFGLTVLGRSENLPDLPSSDPSNVIRRVAFPVRYDVPFSSPVSFRVEGMVTSRASSGGGRRSMTFSQSFAVSVPALDIRVRPLPSDGQPAGFTGAIGEGFHLSQTIGEERVETNDVVVATTVLSYTGGFVPHGVVANEIERRPGRLVWQRYVVADGRASVGDETFVVYDTSRRGYRTLRAPGPRLSYRPAEKTPESSAVAVDIAAADRTARPVKRLRFAPSKQSPVVAACSCGPDAPPARTGDVSGAWTRVACRHGAGWIETKELE